VHPRLQDEAKKDPTVYDKFFKEFGNFIKEGACMDQINKVPTADSLGPTTPELPQ